MFDLGRSLLASVERSPERLAVIDGERRFTYADWFDVVQRAAHGLERLGLKHGDHLMVVMQNRWQMAALHWACQCLGVIVMPINWRATSDELAFLIDNSGAVAIVFDPVTLPMVNECKAAAALTHIAVDVVDAVAPTPVTSFAELIDASPPATIQRADAEDWSLMLYTSGTTGKPKGVPRRQRVERAAAVAHVAQNLYRTGEITLGVMPLYHTMGVRSLLSMALIDGCFVCMPRFDAGATLELIEQHGITNLYLVPTLYHMLLEHPEFASERVVSATKLGFAGAPMSRGLIQRVTEQFKPELFVNHYGSSEVYTFTIDQHAARKPGSSGRAALNQRIRVVPIDASGPVLDLARGEEGEIVADLAGDEAFEGYWKRDDADARSLRDGWYFTGDSGFFDEDGDLFVTGRVDDMIITGGENISPADVENALSTHEDVEEVAVAGLDDEQWGALVTAFIKPRCAIDEDALDAHCQRSGLANFKRPRRYVFVSEIPKSPVGKILRRELVAGRYEEL